MKTRLIMSAPFLHLCSEALVPSCSSLLLTGRAWEARLESTCKTVILYGSVQCATCRQDSAQAEV